jgi:CheY-like chemotaxis protein
MTALRQANQRRNGFHLLLLGNPRLELEAGLTNLRRDSSYTGQPILLLGDAWFSFDMEHSLDHDLPGLVKKIPADNLLDTLPPLLEQERALRILVVDDVLEIRQMIQAFLKRTPHRLETRENGFDAVETFRKQSFDLILMDTEMPGMNGIEATRTIREWEREQQLRRTPILTFSASVLKELQVAAMAAGCDGVVPKPIHKKQLLEVIRRYAQ